MKRRAIGEKNPDLPNAAESQGFIGNSVTAMVPKAAKVYNAQSGDQPA